MAYTIRMGDSPAFLVHEAGAEAAAIVALIGAGRRIAGGTVGVNGTCIGVQRFVRLRTVAVRLPRLGTVAVAAARAGGGDHGGFPGGFTGRCVVPAGTGHRSEENRCQHQSREGAGCGSFDSCGCFHCMTIPFGQGRCLCRIFLPYVHGGTGAPRGPNGGHRGERVTPANAEGGVTRCGVCGTGTWMPMRDTVVPFIKNEAKRFGASGGCPVALWIVWVVVRRGMRGKFWKKWRGRFFAASVSVSVYFSLHGERKVPKEPRLRKKPTVSSLGIYLPDLRARRSAAG